MNNDNVFKIIKRHWYDPPVDVKTIIREADIRYAESVLDSEISGMIEREGSRYAITVNSMDSVPRRRFTAAHELGHFIYHRDLIGDGVDDDRLYRSVPVGRYHNKNITQRHETEANRFAANLLMPKHLVEQLKAENILTTSALAEALGVSVPAMRVREGKTPYPSGIEEFGDATEEDDGRLSELTGEPGFKKR